MMQSPIDAYLIDLSEKLWVKKSRKAEILDEIRLHLSHLGDPGSMSREVIERRFGTARALAGKIHAALPFSQTEPRPVFAWVYLAVFAFYSCLNVFLWDRAEKLGPLGLQGKAEGLGLWVLLGGALFTIAAGAIVSCRLQMPRQAVYLFALVPAFYCMAMRLATLALSLWKRQDAVGWIWAFASQTVFQIGVFTGLGLWLGWICCRIHRYPTKEWHL